MDVELAGDWFMIREVTAENDREYFWLEAPSEPVAVVQVRKLSISDPGDGTAPIEFAVVSGSFTGEATVVANWDGLRLTYMLATDDGCLSKATGDFDGPAEARTVDVAEFRAIEPDVFAGSLARTEVTVESEECEATDAGFVADAWIVNFDAFEDRAVEGVYVGVIGEDGDAKDFDLKIFERDGQLVYRHAVSAPSEVGYVFIDVPLELSADGTFYEGEGWYFDGCVSDGEFIGDDAYEVSTMVQVGFAELPGDRVAVQLAEMSSSKLRADVSDPDVIAACGPTSHFMSAFGLLSEWATFDDTVPSKVAMP